MVTDSRWKKKAPIPKTNAWSTAASQVSAPLPPKIPLPPQLLHPYKKSFVDSKAKWQFHKQSNQLLNLSKSYKKI